MDIILFLFIFPIATIILAIALQKILCNPYLVSAIVLAIFLIVTFTAYGVTFLIAAFIYAIIALITAYIVSIFCKIANRSIEINFIDNSSSCRRNGRSGENYNSCGCDSCSGNSRSSDNSYCYNTCNSGNSRIGEGRGLSCNNDGCNSNNSRQDRNGNNWNCGCGTLKNGDPNTTACRTCACQRQFRNCLRRV